MGHMTPGGDHLPFDDDRKAKYVEALTERGEADYARIIVGITAQTVREHRKKYPEFDQSCENALILYRQRFVDELVRRGVDGVEEPVYYLGQVVGTVTRYSDRLLMEHLKVIDPRYQTKVQVEQTTHITTADLQLDTLQPESRELLQQIIEIESRAAEQRTEADA